MVHTSECPAIEADEAPPQQVVVYYAFACIYSKKWFLCRSRKRFKQLVLLYRLSCAPTSKPLYIPATEPVVGGVYADTDGNVVECLEVEWI